MKENGVTLNLTLVDTPGFGDQLDNTKWYPPLLPQDEAGDGDDGGDGAAGSP